MDPYAQLRPFRYRFGPCAYTAKERELRYAGIRLVLPRQEALLLEALLRCAGEVASKQDLAAVLWPGRQHGDSDRAINTLISKLRRLHPKGTAWIVTIPKCGYKFDLPVETECLPGMTADFLVSAPPVEEPLPENILLPPTTAVPEVHQPPHMVVARGKQSIAGSTLPAWTALLMCLLLLCGASVLLLRWRHAHGQVDLAGPVTLTIVPFSDSGGTAGEVETVREQLADAVAAVPNVEVAASHSLPTQNAPEPVSKSQGLLRSDLLLEGSFVARDEIYSLNLELMRGKNGVHLMSWHYSGPRSSLGTLPEKITEDLAPFLRRGPVTEAQRLLGSTTSEQAYKLAFRAHVSLLQRSRPDVLHAIDLYRQAILLDSRFARAWAGLAESEIVLANFGTGGDTERAFVEARKATLQALAIEPGNAQAHSTLGSILLQHDQQLPEAERQLRLAVSANEGNAANHLHLAVLLVDEKREKEALAEIARAHEVDPQWVVVYGTAMYVHIMTRRYNEAIVDGQTLVSLKPVWSRAHNQLGWAFWYAGHHAPAIKEWKRAAELDSDYLEAAMQQQGLIILEQKGVRAYAEFRIAQHVPGRREEDFVQAEWLAFAGNTDGTLHALEAMMRSHNPESMKIEVNPAYDFLKQDRRFVALIRQIKLQAN